MRRILFVLMAFCFFTEATAQYRSSSKGGGDKWYFGGGFGLSMGTDVTAISASPLVGYKITDQLSGGLSMTYQYVKYKAYDESFSYYGVGPFTRFQITDRYFTHFEYEYLSFEYPTGLTPDGDLETTREGYSSIWLGAGYRESIGRNAGFFLLALYNVLYDEADLNTPYASPLSIRAGVAVGF
jgi:hypothetical protein